MMMHLLCPGFILVGIQQQGIHLQDGLEKVHLDQSDEILTPSPFFCMTKFYPSTTTRHDVGSHYCPPVPPQTLERFQGVYFKCLPLFNINCHIDLLWTLLPKRYQGLGMASCALVSLASKLSFLQCNWDFSATHLTAMMIGYKLFMVEVGL
jgi:hypothetical protein